MLSGLLLVLLPYMTFVGQSVLNIEGQSVHEILSVPVSVCLPVSLSVSLLYGSFYASCINLPSFIRASYNMYINDVFFIVIIIH